MVGMATAAAESTAAATPSAAAAAAAAPAASPGWSTSLRPLSKALLPRPSLRCPTTHIPGACDRNPTALGALHMDPVDPVPASIDGRLLADLTPAAIDALVEAAGPKSGSPLLSVVCIVEIDGDRIIFERTGSHADLFRK